MTDTRIAFVHGRRVWDSRGRPTIEADLLTEGGAVGRGMAPAGAVAGAVPGEARDLRDGDERFGGRDVTKALRQVNTEIARALVGVDAADQALVDRRLIELDGTQDRSRLGANAMIAVSIAAAHAAAASAGEPLYRRLGGPDAVTLPLPHVRMFGDGGGAEVKEFLIICPGAVSFTQALDWSAEIRRLAGEAVPETDESALETLVRAIERTGLTVRDQAAIALDIGSSGMRDTEAMIQRLSGWVDAYPIVSIEDPMAPEDGLGFAAVTAELGTRVQIVGDAFLVSRASRVREAALCGTVNAVLLKPNQRGTLTEARAAWDAARTAGMAGILAARTGETEDTTLVHLAVGWGVGQIKIGAMTGGDRTAKWNEGLRIEEALGGRARFAGEAALGRSGQA